MLEMARMRWFVDHGLILVWLGWVWWVLIDFDGFLISVAGFVG